MQEKRVCAARPLSASMVWSVCSWQLSPAWYFSYPSRIRFGVSLFIIVNTTVFGASIFWHLTGHSLESLNFLTKKMQLRLFLTKLYNACCYISKDLARLLWCLSSSSFSYFSLIGELHKQIRQYPTAGIMLFTSVLLLLLLFLFIECHISICSCIVMTYEVGRWYDSPDRLLVTVILGCKNVNYKY